MTIQKTKFNTVILFPRYNAEIIPDSWSVAKVDDLVKIIDYRGRTPPFSDEGIIHLRSNNIRDGRIKLDDLTYVSEKTYNEYMTRGIPKENDVLFTTEGPLGEVALVPKNFKFSLAQRIVVLRPKSNVILPQFLKWILLDRKIRRRYFGLSTGTTLGGIASKWLTKLFVMYPTDLNEQQKIASILSNLDELMQKTDQIIEQTQRLKKGLIQRLLTKGIGHTKFKKVRIGFQNVIEKYPDSWKIVKLAQIAKIERGKFAHRPRNDPAYYGGNYPFIQTGDIENSDGYIRNFSQTLNEKGISVSKLFPKDVIVITIAATIGSTAITTFPVYFPDSVVGISTSKMNIKFLEYFLRTRKKFLQSNSTVSARSNINLQTLNPLLIPVPPIAEQNQISSILSCIDEFIKQRKTEKIKLDNLKKGLMQQLLTGKIMVKV